MMISKCFQSRSPSSGWVLAMVLAMNCNPAVRNETSEAPASETAGENMLEYYELRVYRIDSLEKQKVVSGFLENALLPALNRMGIDRIGVFTLQEPGDDFSIFTLIPYPTLDHMTRLSDVLDQDADYQQAASEYFAASIDDPAYGRIESKLMKAFDSIPVMELPKQTATGDTRIFELANLREPSRERGLPEGADVRRGRDADHAGNGPGSRFLRRSPGGPRRAELDLHAVEHRSGDAQEELGSLPGSSRLGQDEGDGPLQGHGLQDRQLVSDPHPVFADLATLRVAVAAFGQVWRKRLRYAAWALLVLALGSFLIFQHYARRALPQLDGTRTVTGLEQPVEIVRDRWGVPHIFAGSDTDAYFALGYVHAQDRLFQMDLSRHASQGRLAELVGEPGLDLDLLFRTIDLHGPPRRMLERASAPVRSAARAYALGINTAVAHLDGALPLEFTLLNHEFEPAEPDDFVGLIGLMTWGLNLSWEMDRRFEQLAARLGEERALELFPFVRGGTPAVHPRGRVNSARITGHRICGNCGVAGSPRRVDLGRLESPFSGNGSSPRSVERGAATVGWCPPGAARPVTPSWPTILTWGLRFRPSGTRPISALPGSTSLESPSPACPSWWSGATEASPGG